MALTLRFSKACDISFSSLIKHLPIEQFILFCICICILYIGQIIVTSITRHFFQRIKNNFKYRSMSPLKDFGKDACPHRIFYSFNYYLLEKCNG